MHNFETYFFWALAACILRQGSFAEDQSGYICVIENPKQNQCDSICLTELSPRFSEIVKAQNQGNTRTRESDNEIKSKLETLEVKIAEVQSKLEGKLQGVEAKLERQLQVQAKLEGQQTKMEAKLADTLLAVKTKLEGQLPGVENKLEGHLQEMHTKVEAKLETSLHEVKTKLEGHLQGVEAKLEGQLQEMQTKLEAKLEDSLLTVKTKLEGQQLILTMLKDSQAKLAVQAKIDNQLQLVVNQLQAVSNKIDAKVGVPAVVTITIPFGFERIGSRHFRIVEEEDSNWETAERRCREMGGYLASFRNKEEFDAILDKIGKDKWYYLGINDRKNEGHFVSVASDKPAQFFKWSTREPNDENREQNCVVLHNGEMYDAYSIHILPFICQADNET